MKMIMVVYNEAMDSEVMDILQGCALKNYTKVMGVFGKGSASGIHLGTDIWPGKNNILYVGCKEDEARQLLSCIKNLRRMLKKEGVKAFMWDIEDLTE